jgi:hypothetical protein
MGNVDLSLTLSALVCFSGERLEVLGLSHVLEFFDVGVVDTEAKLIELLLDAFDDLKAVSIDIFTVLMLKFVCYLHGKQDSYDVYA